MVNHRLIKKEIILLFCISIEIDICAEGNRVSGFRLNLVPVFTEPVFHDQFKPKNFCLHF
jgi:hypothetical protein